MSGELDSWSHPEIVRALQSMKTTLDEIRSDQKAQRSEFVPREVWDGAWRALDDWKSMVVTDVVNLDASLTRSTRDHSTEHAALRGHIDTETGVLRGHIDTRVAAERADRVSGQRWALTLSATGVIGLIGLLLSIVNGVG